jgi:hypothetical protein
MPYFAESLLCIVDTRASRHGRADGQHYIGVIYTGVKSGRAVTRKTRSSILPIHLSLTPRPNTATLQKSAISIGIPLPPQHHRPELDRLFSTAPCALLSQLYRPANPNPTPKSQRSRRPILYTVIGNTLHCVYTRPLRQHLSTHPLIFNT